MKKSTCHPFYPLNAAITLDTTGICSSYLRALESKWWYADWERRAKFEVLPNQWWTPPFLPPKPSGRTRQPDFGSEHQDVDKRDKSIIFWVPAWEAGEGIPNLGGSRGNPQVFLPFFPSILLLPSPRPSQGGSGQRGQQSPISLRKRNLLSNQRICDL